MTRILLFVLLFIVSVSADGLSAQQIIKGCNGKTYQTGDTLMIGNGDISAIYYYVKLIDDQGGLNALTGENMQGKKIVITAIPEYDKKRYEEMALFEKYETPMLAMATDGQQQYCISLNEALSRGNIVSEYKKSQVEGAIDLSPDMLFVYACKLYKTPIDESAVDTYLSLIVPDIYAKSMNDPFALSDLRTEYKEKLEQSIATANFNTTFRIKCSSLLSQYDIANKSFGLDGFNCLDIKTNQDDQLTKIGYCLWEECAFRFLNSADFKTFTSDTNTARGFYEMRKYANVPAYKQPIATSYVYVKIKEKDVSLPANRVYVSKVGQESYFSTLDKVYGKRTLDMEIVQLDVFNDLSAIPSSKIGRAHV